MNMPPGLSRAEISRSGASTSRPAGPAAAVAGWFDGARRNVKVHPDTASAAAEFIHRLAAWLARREIL
jgi:hypothetical protein